MEVKIKCVRSGNMTYAESWRMCRDVMSSI